MKNLRIFLISVIIFAFSLGSIPVSAYTPQNIEFHCESVLLANTATGEVLYSENCDAKVYPASITKVMTAIIALEVTEDLDKEMVTAPNYIFDMLYGLGGSTGGIQKGEIMPMRDLLACLLLPSANEAALMIADHIGNGDINVFVDMMNQKAKELGMNDTHFLNPHGLHEDGHYTTANDIYKMVSYAIKNPIFKEYVSTTRYTLKATNKSSARTIATTNKMMDKALGDGYYYGSYDGVPVVTGVKTGYTKEAGRCFVGTASMNGIDLMAVCMHAPITDENGYSISKNYAFVDTEALLDWGFRNFSYKKMADANEPIAEVKLSLSNETDSLILYPQNDVTVFTLNNVDPSSVKIQTVGVPKSLDAPIKKGQVIGEAVLWLADKEIGRVNLVANEDIERDNFLYVMRGIKRVVTSPQFIFAVAILFLLIILYIIVTVKSHKKRKKNRLEYIGKKQNGRYDDSRRKF